MNNLASSSADAANTPVDPNTKTHQKKQPHEAMGQLETKPIKPVHTAATDQTAGDEPSSWPPSEENMDIEDEAGFCLTVKNRRPRKTDGSPAHASLAGIILWGPTHPPRDGAIALGTIGVNRAHGADFILCARSGQQYLLNLCMAALCDTLDATLHQMDPEAYNLIAAVNLGPRLGAGRGFLLCKPYCYPQGAFQDQASAPLWAIVLWPSEVASLRSMELCDFIDAMNASSLDFLDIERPSLSGEKLPERRKNPIARALLDSPLAEDAYEA
jgi:hypothetical protein